LQQFVMATALVGLRAVDHRKADGDLGGIPEAVR
jgi:hypothetical protein